MGRWAVAEESHNDRRYKYMVGREAFDWLLLGRAALRRGQRVHPERETWSGCFSTASCRNSWKMMNSAD